MAAKYFMAGLCIGVLTGFTSGAAITAVAMLLLGSKP
jgi:gas vesicle protein